MRTFAEIFGTCVVPMLWMSTCAGAAVTFQYSVDARVLPVSTTELATVSHGPTTAPAEVV